MNANPMQYSPAAILEMRPATLRYCLTKRLVTNPDLGNQIAALVGFEPRWYRMSTAQMAQIALAWAYIESVPAIGYTLKETINRITHSAAIAEWRVK